MKQTLRIYGFWAGWATVVFFAIYPTLNWYTSIRPDRYQLYIQAELAVPFVPEFIWAYLSMYLLFPLPLFLVPAERIPTLGKQLIVGTLLSGLMFFLFPGDLGFVRELPADPFYARVYAKIFGIDPPHNLVPSLHILWSLAVVQACADVGRPLMRVLLYTWLALISASTLLVHQHHLLDVISAVPLVLLLRWWFPATSRA